MRELRVASRVQVDEEKTNRHFHYYLVVDPIETEQFSLENYGIKIWEEGGSSELIRGITTSATRIDELISLLVEHTVGPTSLPDVLSDWL